MVAIGTLIVNLNNPQFNANHYSKYIRAKEDSLKTITFKVRETLKPTNYHEKYIVDILTIDSSKVNGRSLLNVEKDSTFSQLKVDDILICKTLFKAIPEPLNPHQFNYKSFLKKKSIYHQIVTNKKRLLPISSKPHTLLGMANYIRDHINSKLKAYHFKPDVLAIINAFLLGQRQDISDSIYSNYVNAGAIHILAVSGLHVGIILLILSYLLKPLESFKHGKLVKTIILVSILWCFATIAGLSASVTRAVTMFSIVAIAINLKRPTNIFNTLAISMFIILLIKPLFLFDVGFQLSYLAVFAIVSIDPLLYKLWQPRYRPIDTLWHTLSITLSAQLGILPLSLFYFHQFPSLFFVSNLVIVPLLGIILGLGILLIALALLNLLPQFYASLFGNLIELMNRFVKLLSQQEAFLIKSIAFNFLFLICAYFLLITLINSFYKRTYKRFVWVLTAIACFQLSYIYTTYNKPKHQLVIFHKNRQTLLANTLKSKTIIAHDLKNAPSSSIKPITDYTTGNHISEFETDSLQPVYILNNKTLLVIDSLGIYNIKSFKPDYVLLRQSPQLNLNRLIDSLNPKHIIADGSNYKSYTTYWESICKKRKLPFHNTSKKGAFIINY
ncbi:ComEC/Rec2 family competence protein [Snuella lapsa]|uniref:ComEC/Rec2 family competence protein n=2 Tax=Snuella lapsa TaxID=870481 RepID=A0ABP6Y898_9FLAO